MTFSRDTTVGELARRFPATVRVFQQRKVEFCCGGHRSLGQVCRDKDLSYEVLASELERAVSTAPPRTTWADRPLSELTAHIEEAFHDPIRQDLPRVRQLSAKVHGHDDSRRRALTIIQYELGRFEAELSVQMNAEEAELFPLITQAESRALTGAERWRWVALRRQASEFHGDAAYTLRMLRQITDGYLAPSDACASLRALYRGLEDFDRLMQLHIHLEMNVLFSRAATLMSGPRAEIYR